ncbi:MAG TPA: spore germination protein [Symbiobacteriaceae bacterium]
MPDNPSLNQSLEANKKLLKQAFATHRGMIFRELTIPAPGGQTRTALLVFAEAETDNMRLDTFVVRPLLEGDSPGYIGGSLAPSPVPMKKLNDAIGFVTRGKVLFQVEGTTEMFAVEVSNLPHRQIGMPETESGINGPKEAFTEHLIINLTQMRRRLPGKFLKIESLFIGTEAKLEAVIIYVEGKPTQTMIDTIRQRLNKVTQDGVQDVTELAEAVADAPLTLFPSIMLSERPDLVCHYLMGGRIAVMVENSPRALVVPAVANDFFTSSDDWYEWRPFVAFLRALRYLAFLIAVPLPALYVSVTTYHLQALPTQLTLSLLAQREGAPLPPPIEALVMTLIFEILREAGIRLPRTIGPTVSIVGGLVIGEAAIRSGITSPAMVLVVSATAVATFSLPSTTLANAATYTRFVVLALASTFGFFGLLLGYLLVITILASTTSLGVPYETPFFPLRPKFLPVSFGVQPRPPKSTGGTPSPKKTNQAEDYQEG